MTPVEITFAAAALLMAAMVLLPTWILLRRISLARAEAHREGQHALWRPLLWRALEGEIDASAFEVPERDFDLFAALVTSLVETIEGEDRQRLRRLMDELGLVRHYTDALGNRDRWRRLHATYVLGTIREPTAVAALQRGLDDRDDLVRLASAQALAQGGRSEHVPVLLEALAAHERWSEEMVCEVLLDLGPDKADDLLLLLSDHELTPRQQRLVVQLLGYLRHLPAAPVLVQHLNTTEDENMRRRIVAALGQMSSLENVVALQSYLEDAEPEMRAAAARALGRIGDERALAPLRRALDDPEWAVRYNAAWALLEMGAAGAGAVRSRADRVDGHGSAIARQVLGEYALGR